MDWKRMHRGIGILCSITMLLLTGFPQITYGGVKTETIVKVGYVTSPNFTEGKSDDDAKRGYGYEYLQKVSAYTGWNYEYVYGEWSEILEMLKNGEVDVMTGISYSEEREEYFSFPEYCMGVENYYIYSYEDQPLVTDNLVGLKGAKIGCTRDSMQHLLLENWNRDMGNVVQVIPFDGNDAMYDAFDSYEIDAAVDTDIAIVTEDRMIPIEKIGSSEYYMAVAKGRKDLLQELNACLERINNEEPYWIEQLHNKYFSETAIRMTFSKEERKWIKNHGKIRIGYEPNFLAFCAYNEETGQAEGALNTFLQLAKKDFSNFGIDFEPIPYDTVEASLQALENGEIDVVFPMYQNLYLAEARKLIVTDKLSTTAMTAMIHDLNFSEFEQNKVAVVKGFTDIEWYIADRYPNWEIVYYDSFKECLNAVKAGQADCVVESTYVYKTLIGAEEINTISLSQNADISFVVNKGDSVLFAIMNRMITVDSGIEVVTALSQYSNPNTGMSFHDFVKKYIFQFILLIVCILATLLWLLLLALNSKNKEQKAKLEAQGLNQELRAQHKELEEALQRAHHDALTGLYNRYYCNELAAEMDKNGLNEKLTIIILDVNRLKAINDSLGHEAGDELLSGVAELLKVFFKEDQCFRTGGDEFLVISQRKEVSQTLEEFKLAVSKWKGQMVPGMTISVGLASREEFPDKNYLELFAEADSRMYENKNEFYRMNGLERRRR